MRSSLLRPVPVIAAAVLGAGVSLTLVTAASAHAEIDVEPAQALATDAVVTVFPEAHNHNAGAVSVEVFLPEGIAPADVTLLEGPDGWEMTTGEESYTIAGDELEIDVSPLHEIQVRQLPDAEEIWFRILTTYRDGQVDRWIEVPSEDNPNPGNAAAGAALSPADPAASPTAPPEPTDSPTPADSPTAAPTDMAAADNGANVGLLVALGVAALLVAATIGWAIARRRGAGAADGPPEG